MAKILVIDDEQGIRNHLDTLLRRKGYDVVLADGGRKGLELFLHERPDVMVLDLNMPEMDEVAVLQQVRTLNPDQPVIVLTRAGTLEKEQRVHALGVSEFVEKEFSTASARGGAEASDQDYYPAGVASTSASACIVNGTFPSD